MDNRDTPNWKGRPSLVLSHPNARGTGSTLWMTLVPATGDHCGFIRVRIAPQSKKQGSSLLTKTENVAVGGSRGGRTVYRDVEMPTLAGRAVKVASSVGKSAASTFSDASRALYEAGQKLRVTGFDVLRDCICQELGQRGKEES